MGKVVKSATHEMEEKKVERIKEKLGGVGVKRGAGGGSVDLSDRSLHIPASPASQPQRHCHHMRLEGGVR